MSKHTQPHYVGHRERLRQRFLTSFNLPDYELLELLLFQAIPRKDTKPLAKELLKQFGSLGRVFGADIEALKAFGVTDSVVTALKLAYVLHLRMLQTDMYERKVLSSFDALEAYVRQALVSLTEESFLVLCLDSNLGLIQDKVHQTGTLNYVAVYPREIVKDALNCGAAHIVLAHNHPGGNPKPSFEDLKLTHDIKALAESLDIGVLDHLIVGHSGVVSLKALGHL